MQNQTIAQRQYGRVSDDLIRVQNRGVQADTPGLMSDYPRTVFTGDLGMVTIVVIPTGRA